MRFIGESFAVCFRASIFRLKSQHTKLCSELETEREVATVIRERLDCAEYVCSILGVEQLLSHA